MVSVSVSLTMFPDREVVEGVIDHNTYSFFQYIMVILTNIVSLKGM